MRLQHDLAARHAFAHVVVRLAFEMQMQAARIPDAEALARGALEGDDQRRLGHAVVAPVLGDFPRHARADGAMKITDGISELAAEPAVDACAHVGDHLLVETLLCRKARCAARCSTGARPRQRPLASNGEIELALLRGLARQNLQQVGATDELGDAAHAEERHDLAALLRHEPEIVHDHFGQADEIVGAQHVVLRGDAGRAIVEVADAQVLAAESHHRRGAETEALGADDAPP